MSPTHNFENFFNLPEGNYYFFKTYFIKKKIIFHVKHPYKYYLHLTHWYKLNVYSD